MNDEELRHKIDEQRAILNALTKEWLDEKFAQFGRWTFYGILAVAFVCFVRTLFSLNAADLKAAIEAAQTIQGLSR